MSLVGQEKELMDAKDQLWKARNDAAKLKQIIGDVLDWLAKAIDVLRVLLYAGSVGATWFYLHDKVLAIGIAASLTIVHMLIAAKEMIDDKKRELVEHS
jgi:hypothetical protein